MAWRDRMTAQELEVIEATGWGGRQGYGQRPALLVVDVTYGFTGDKPEPILTSIQRFPTSCGEPAWAGVRAIGELLVATRAAGVPVIYTRNDFHPMNLDLGSWRWKNDRVADGVSKEDKALSRQIVADIGPLPEDLVITKTKPSAFFGTHLVAHLVERGIDQLIVVGCVTSGCVRATVVDAFSNNYRVAVVEEGTFDRIPLSHEVSLLEMDAKYADVRSLEDVKAYLARFEATMEPAA